MHYILPDGTSTRPHSSDVVEYYVYPDGTSYSCEEWTLEDLISTGHSDDCAVMELPDNIDCAETYFYDLVMEVNLGTSTERKTIL